MAARAARHLRRSPARRPRSRGDLAHRAAGRRNRTARGSRRRRRRARDGGAHRAGRCGAHRQGAGSRRRQRRARRTFADANPRGSGSSRSTKATATRNGRRRRCSTGWRSGSTCIRSPRETSGSRPIRPSEIAAARARLTRIEASDEAISALVGVADQLGVASLRAPLLALRAARAACALRGGDTIEEADIALAAALVLGPRATRVPAPAEDAPSEDEFLRGAGDAAR